MLHFALFPFRLLRSFWVPGSECGAQMSQWQHVLALHEAAQCEGAALGRTCLSPKIRLLHFLGWTEALNHSTLVARVPRVFSNPNSQSGQRLSWHLGLIRVLAFKCPRKFGTGRQKGTAPGLLLENAVHSAWRQARNWRGSLQLLREMQELVLVRFVLVLCFK